MEPRCLITALGSQCEHYRSRVILKCRVRLCVATWVDWWRSVCLNAQRIKPSCLPSNSVRLRSSGRCDCFVRELRDYSEYRLACPIVLDTRRMRIGRHPQHGREGQHPDSWSARSRAAPHIGLTICKKHTLGDSKSLWSSNI